LKAIRVDAHGGPEVLRLAEVARPEPGPDEVLIRLGASGVNFIDVYHRTGQYPLPVPFVPGSEGAGAVEAVGHAVTGVAVGDRVGWVGIPGSYAEYAAVPADRVVRLPAAVPDDLAAATLLQGMTAHYLVHDTFPVTAGQTVLVHAAAGGTGLLLTQLARRLGARVIGTTSTEEKAELARSAGATDVIRYDNIAADDVAKADGIVKEVHRLTDGDGVHVVYDGVGRATFEASLASLRPRGMLVLFGAASGQPPPFDLARLGTAGSLFVTRPSLAHHIADPAELARRAGQTLGLVADGSLRVKVSGRYPLAQARQAHEDLQSRRTTGKLLLLP
jgi:NADPH:quinone reductase